MCSRRAAKACFEVPQSAALKVSRRRSQGSSADEVLSGSRKSCRGFERVRPLCQGGAGADAGVALELQRGAQRTAGLFVGAPDEDRDYPRVRFETRFDGSE